MSQLQRSWMFVPGHTERFVTKAAGVPADAVFLDLEDGVPVPEKPNARRQVAETLGWKEFGPRRFARLNSMASPWFDDDVDAVVLPGIAGVCLPKVESATDVLRLAARLDELERQRSMEGGSVRIVAAIESARGLLAAPAIAASSPRVEGLMFGAEDYALDLGLGTDRVGESAELIYARSSLVVAAASARVASIDGVFPNLDDPDGLAADILQARRLGFTGKSTFNPRQIEDINYVFSPSDDEIDYAKKVVEAFDEAQARGDGSVAVGGQLVDLPIVMRAKRLLEARDLLATTGSSSEARKDG